MGSDFVDVATENLSPELSSDFAAGRATLETDVERRFNGDLHTDLEAGKTQLHHLRYSDSDSALHVVRRQSSGGDINTELNLLVVPAVAAVGGEFAAPKAWRLASAQSQTPGASQ